MQCRVAKFSTTVAFLVVLETSNSRVERETKAVEDRNTKIGVNKGGRFKRREITKTGTIARASAIEQSDYS